MTPGGITTPLISAFLCIHVATVVLGASNSTTERPEICATVLSTDTFAYKVGDIISITCTVDATTPLDGTQLCILHTTRFDPVGINVSINNITGNQAFAYIEAVDTSSEGTYTCKYGYCDASGLRSMKTIVVRQPVLVPPTFQCISNNNWNMTCVWGTSQHGLGPIQWKLRYKSKLMANYSCCTDDHGSDQCPEFTASTSCVIKDHKFNQNQEYSMLLSMKTSLGINLFNYTVSADDSILRLNPVDDVQVYPEAPEQLAIQMLVDISPRAHHVVCHMTIQSEWDEDTYVNMTRELNQLDLSVKIVLYDLEAFTKYYIGIVCKPKYSPYWSEPVLAYGRTLPEAPLAAPHIIGFTDIVADTTLTERRIVLYWKTVPRRYLRGDNAFYNVTLLDDDDNAWAVFGVDVITAKINVTLAINHAYRIILRAQNEAGSSLNASVIGLPKYNKEMNAVVVVVDKVTRGFKVVLFEGIEVIGETNTSYTYRTTQYYWCQGEYNIFPPICMTPIESKTVDRYDMKETYLTTSPPIPGYTWYFGVSITQLPEDQVTVTGQATVPGQATVLGLATVPNIVWSYCVFLHPSKPSTSFPSISAERSADNASIIIVSLLFNYCLMQDMPLMYQVGVKMNNSLGWNNTDGYWEANAENITNITATPRTKTITIAAASIHEDVTVCFRTVYNGGVIDVSDEVIVRKGNKLAMFPEENASKNATIVGIVVAVVVSVVFILALIVKYCRAKFQKSYKIDDVFSSADAIYAEAYEHQHQETFTLDQWYDAISLNEEPDKPGYARETSVKTIQSDQGYSSANPTHESNATDSDQRYGSTADEQCVADVKAINETSNYDKGCGSTQHNGSTRNAEKGSSETRVTNTDNILPRSETQPTDRIEMANITNWGTSDNNDSVDKKTCTHVSNILSIINTNFSHSQDSDAGSSCRNSCSDYFNSTFDEDTAVDEVKLPNVDVTVPIPYPQANDCETTKQHSDTVPTKEGLNEMQDTNNDDYLVSDNSENMSDYQGEDHSPQVGIHNINSSGIGNCSSIYAVEESEIDSYILANTHVSLDDSVSLSNDIDSYQKGSVDVECDWDANMNGINNTNVDASGNTIYRVDDTFTSNTNVNGLDRLFLGLSVDENANENTFYQTGHSIADEQISTEMVSFQNNNGISGSLNNSSKYGTDSTNKPIENEPGSTEQKMSDNELNTDEMDSYVQAETTLCEEPSLLDQDNLK